jgi:hypothetical protein
MFDPVPSRRDGSFPSLLLTSSAMVNDTMDLETYFDHVEEKAHGSKKAGCAAGVSVKNELLGSGESPGSADLLGSGDLLGSEDLPPSGEVSGSGEVLGLDV